jgi:hypothetical protein
MAHRSSVRRLPDEVRAEVDRLLTDGRYTLDQIVKHLRGLGVDSVSRSAIGRYSQQFERIAEDIKLTREMARAVGAELADLVEDDATQLVVGSIQALLLKARMQFGPDDEIRPKDVADLARASKDLATALRSRAHLRTAVRRELEAEVAGRAEQAAEAVDQLAQEHGLSAALAAQLRREVLGVKLPTAA